MSSIVPIEVLNNRNNIENYVKPRLHTLLSHPLTLFTLQTLGKLPFIEVDRHVFLITHPILYEEILREMEKAPFGFIPSLARLGELYYEVVKRSNMLIPLLDVEWMIPIVPIPEVLTTYVDRERLLKLYNIEEKLSNMLLQEYRKHIPQLGTVDIDITTSDIATMIVRSPKFRLGDAFLYDIGVGYIPFLVIGRIERPIMFKGNENFTSPSEVLDWYINHRYREPISNILLRDVLFRDLKIEVSPFLYSGIKLLEMLIPSTVREGSVIGLVKIVDRLHQPRAILHTLTTSYLYDLDRRLLFKVRHMNVGSRWETPELIIVPSLDVRQVRYYPIIILPIEHERKIPLESDKARRIIYLYLTPLLFLFPNDDYLIKLLTKLVSEVLPSFLKNVEDVRELDLFLSYPLRGSISLKVENNMPYLVKHVAPMLSSSMVELEGQLSWPCDMLYMSQVNNPIIIVLDLQALGNIDRNRLANILYNIISSYSSVNSPVLITVKKIGQEKPIVLKHDFTLHELGSIIRRILLEES